MLKVNNINVFYGKVQALFDVSFEAGDKEIVSIIGANGAGKTTLMKTIMGINQPRGGSIEYNGSLISNLPVHKVVRKKIVYVPEGREIFPAMTVQENLEMGAYIRNDNDKIVDDFERVFERLPRLKERRRQMAGTLSGGEQQMLAIGRALMCNPKMLLLDEPSMGLSPLLVNEIFSIIQDVNKSGVTILLVEQNAKKALEIANRAYVLETGSIAMSGDADELANNKKVQSAYLGG